jgi:hypothetical protein
VLRGRVSVPGFAAPPVPADPLFLFRGGRVLLPNPQVQIIFWGQSWPGLASPSIDQVVSRMASLLASHYMSPLSEYRTSGPGTVNGVTVTAQLPVAMPAPGTPVNDPEIQNLLNTLFTNQLVPDPRSNPELLYLVFVEPGPSNPALYGEHNFYMAPLPGGIQAPAHYGYVLCPPGHYTGGPTANPDLDFVTMVASHELVEACTDTEPGSGWVHGVPGGGFDEIGDYGMPYVPGGYRGLVNDTIAQSWFSDRHDRNVCPIFDFQLDQPPAGWTQVVPAGSGGPSTPLNPFIVSFGPVLTNPGPRAGFGLGMSTNSSTSAACSCIAMRKAIPLGMVLNTDDVRLTASWFSTQTFASVFGPTFSQAGVGITLRRHGVDVVARLLVDNSAVPNNCAGAYNDRQVVVNNSGFDIDLGSWIAGREFDEVQVALTGYACGFTGRWFSNSVQLAGLLLEAEEIP